MYRRCTEDVKVRQERQWHTWLRLMGHLELVTFWRHPYICSWVQTYGQMESILLNRWSFQANYAHKMVMDKVKLTFFTLRVQDIIVFVHTKHPEVFCSFLIDSYVFLVIAVILSEHLSACKIIPGPQDFVLWCGTFHVLLINGSG